MLIPRRYLPLAPSPIVFASLLLIANGTIGQELSSGELAARFAESVKPLVSSRCETCHDTEHNEAGLDLSIFANVRHVIDGHQVWQAVLERVEAGEMPPADSEQSLSDVERAELVSWIRALLRAEANRNAGDPGIVLARRLSNAEYDHTIRDLTGVDIRPTQTFPIDPANEAGFDNSGESLAMSPALLNKYLEAARMVAEHLVLTPDGIRFAAHPVMTDTDRDKYCVNRIVDFYRQQPIDYADYFFAAWDYHQQQRELANGVESLARLATAHRVSAKYLQQIVDTVTTEMTQLGPLGDLLDRWKSLTMISDPELAREQCEELRDFVLAERAKFQPHFDNLQIKGVHNGSQTFVLWKNQQYAEHRQRAAESAIVAAVNEFTGDNPLEKEQAAALRASCQRFCQLFPDRFFVSERGRDYLGTPREKQEKGRLLSAGFHSMMGYFRDDRPLYELILNASEQQQLDRLWRELDFVTSAPMRQYQGFLWFERTDSAYLRDPEFDFARPEDLSSLQAEQIEQLGERYLAKAKRNGGKEVPLRAIEAYFEAINQQIRWVESARLAAEPLHLEALIDFAAKAYRRPLEPAEEADLKSFYHDLRQSEDVTHAEAIEDTLVMILMSPHFCYRLDLLSDSEAERALDPFELASRLSFFLWASTPDQELLELAADGTLASPEVITAQTRRMLADPKVRGLVTEFGGNWLDFRRFEQHNSVDRKRFPQFNDALRTAMYEEPIRFLTDLFQSNRSVLDCLYSERIFVNEVLAKHYGIDSEHFRDDRQLELSPEGEEPWFEVDQASQFGRGGLLTMSVFLTKNSPGLRTSPVKRGYWVVRRLLGEQIPPPPPNVPELPDDESQLGDLTLREMLAKHRQHTSCAGCHDRFDALGLVFEGFGPVGERRTRDLGDRPVETSAEFPDGSQREGVRHLQDYLRTQREAEFIDNMCRKLLSFALGRTLILSDEGLVDRMRSNAVGEGYQVQTLFETIVTSRQFLRKRGRNTSLALNSNQQTELQSGGSHE
ncbi:DUF1592 domain-containing protein [Planctomycetaceae bacterium SH139]